MSSEEKYNEIDKLFRSRLEKSQDQPEGWNMPSDEILERAFQKMDQADKKPNKRRFLFYWISGMVLIAGLIASLFLTNSHEIEDLNARVDELAKTVNSDLTGNTEVINFENSKIENPPIEIKDEGVRTNLTNRESVDDTVIGINTLHNNNMSGFANNDHKVSGSVLISDISEESLQGNIFSDSPASKVQSGEGKSGAHLSHSRTTKTSISTLPLTKQRIYFQRPSKFGINPVNAVSVSTNPRMKWSIGAGHLCSNLLMPDVQNTKSSLTKYDDFKSGWFIEMGLRHKLTKKLDLGLNVGYTQLSNISIYRSLMNYNSSKEYQNNQGVTFYKTNMSINTPLGSSVKDFDMNMTGKQMNDGDVMNNMTKIEQKIDFLTVDINANYRLWSLKKFHLDLNAGIGFNRILKSEGKMEVYMFDQNELMGEKAYEEDENYALKPSFASGIIGVSLKYNINDIASISLGSRYMRSLTSVTNTEMTMGQRTMIQGFKNGLSLEIGL